MGDAAGLVVLPRPYQKKMVSTWQVEMGWPDIHWLARDLGWAGGSHCVSFGQDLEYAVGA